MAPDKHADNLNLAAVFHVSAPRWSGSAIIDLRRHRDGEMMLPGERSARQTVLAAGRGNRSVK
jgi:hypothetical protein